MASELGVQTIQHTNGTDAMTIDSTGRILTPARPAFSVYSNALGSSVDVTGDVFDVNTFDTVEFNIGNCVALSSGVATFTAPITGIYQFNWTVILQSTSAANYVSTYLYIYESGSSQRYSGKDFNYRNINDYGNNSNTDYYTHANAGLAQLSASDTVKVLYEVSNDTTTQLRKGCRFSGFLVG